MLSKRLYQNDNPYKSLTTTPFNSRRVSVRKLTSFLTFYQTHNIKPEIKDKEEAKLPGAFPPSQNNYIKYIYEDTKKIDRDE